jgi:hypothetical protein
VPLSQRINHPKPCLAEGMHLASRDCGETSTLRATLTTHQPSQAVAGRGPAPGKSRLLREENAQFSSREAAALPSHGCAVQRMFATPPASHNCGETKTSIAARETRLTSRFSTHGRRSACAWRPVRLRVPGVPKLFKFSQQQPLMGAALARHSRSRPARPHARACALYAACHSIDPGNSSAALPRVHPHQAGRCNWPLSGGPVHSILEITALFFPQWNKLLRAE